MFEKVSQLAEQAAMKTSRRDFLSRLGRSALTAAAAVGGLLALPAVAKAGRRNVLCSSTNSAFWCLNHVVGSPCLNGGKCTVIKGTVNDCYCRDPGNPGR